MVGVIERARREGLDVTCDMYPYIASGSGLNQYLSQWVQEGGVGPMLSRLRDPGDRLRTRRDMESGNFGGIPWMWDKMVISYVGSYRNRDVVGKTLAEISESRADEPADTLLALIDEEDNQVGVVHHNRVESDMRLFMTHPDAMIGSDGRAISPEGFWSQDRPHPRFYGTYPRILGRYVRDEQVLSLETAVHKMTGFPARRLGLQDRGLIAESLVADLAVFDPEAIIDRASFEEPHQLAEGVSHLFVDGEPVIANGEQTPARPGRVLRRGA